MKDLYGSEIMPGDWITYPVRQGSWLGMEHACVLELQEPRPRTMIAMFPYPRYQRARPATIKAEKRDGKIVYITNISNVAIAPEDWVP